MKNVAEVEHLADETLPQPTPHRGAELVWTAVSFAALLFGLPRIRQVYTDLLPQASAYFQPFIAGEALRDRHVILVLALLLAPLLVRRGPLRWESVAGGKAVRTAIFLGLAALSWKFSTYHYNYYFDQAHLFDRALILALAVGCWFTPAALPLFIFQALAVDTQFGIPMGLYFTTDRQVVFDALVLTLIQAYLWVLRPRSEPAPLFVLLLSMLGSGYFTPIVEKIRLSPNGFDWILANDMGNLLVSSYQQGWLSFLNQQQIVAAAGWVTRFSVPLQIGCTVIEVAALLIVFESRMARVLLCSFTLFHLGVLSLSGIFFWKWIALEIGYCFAIAKMGPSLRRALFRPAFGIIAAALMLIACPLFSDPFQWRPVRLGWFDTRLNQRTAFQAVDVEGKVYNLSSSEFAPYDFVFATSALEAVARNPRLTGISGTMAHPLHAAEWFRSLERARNKDEAAELIAQHGSVLFNENLLADFRRFLLGYFSHRNVRIHPGIVPGWLQAPLHIGNSIAHDRLPDDAKVASVRIRLVETFFSGTGIETISDSQLLEVPIPAASQN